MGDIFYTEDCIPPRLSSTTARGQQLVVAAPILEDFFVIDQGFCDGATRVVKRSSMPFFVSPAFSHHLAGLLAVAIAFVANFALGYLHLRLFVLDNHQGIKTIASAFLLEGLNDLQCSGPLFGFSLCATGTALWVSFFLSPAILATLCRSNVIRFVVAFIVAALCSAYWNVIRTIESGQPIPKHNWVEVRYLLLNAICAVLIILLLLAKCIPALRARYRETQDEK